MCACAGVCVCKYIAMNTDFKKRVCACVCVCVCVCVCAYISTLTYYVQLHFRERLVGRGCLYFTGVNVFLVLACESSLVCTVSGTANAQGFVWKFFCTTK